MSEKRVFVFTFGQAHTDSNGAPLGGCFVEIEAETHEEARLIMREARGPFWATSYLSREEAGVEDFSLAERSLDAVRLDLRAKEATEEPQGERAREVLTQAAGPAPVLAENKAADDGEDKAARARRKIAHLLVPRSPAPSEISWWEISEPRRFDLIDDALVATFLRASTAPKAPEYVAAVDAEREAHSAAVRGYSACKCGHFITEPGAAVIMAMSFDGSEPGISYALLGALGWFAERCYRAEQAGNGERWEREVRAKMAAEAEAAKEQAAETKES